MTEVGRARRLEPMRSQSMAALRGLQTSGSSLRGRLLRVESAILDCPGLDAQIVNCPLVAWLLACLVGGANQ